MTTVVDLIAKKRDGGALSPSEIAHLITALGEGSLADYQMAALLMAVYFQGLNGEETVSLTRAMRDSGRVVDLSHIDRPKVDKHSTGGVGDKVSICLAPLVAACGAAVPMVSGRGLGHTGGTLDKLEAIPGFIVDQSLEDFTRIVGEVGVCMVGQTGELAPADKKMYALRDVTATVESIPLIVASILSKKLAEGIDALVLDVKVGRGAFMKSVDQARALAEALVDVGTGAGKEVRALLTDMSHPLGLTIGNALETREAIEVLTGGGPADLVACTLALGGEMLAAAGLVDSAAAGEAAIDEARGDGRGAEVFAKMVAAQGGDASVVDAPDRLPKAPLMVDVEAPRSGFVTSIDALELGLTAVAMGAGRTRADQPVDPAVGIALCVRPGDAVERGQPLARLHLHDRDGAPTDRVARAVALGEEPVAVSPLVLDRR